MKYLDVEETTWKQIVHISKLPAGSNKIKTDVLIKAKYVVQYWWRWPVKNQVRGTNTVHEVMEPLLHLGSITYMYWTWRYESEVEREEVFAIIWVMIVTGWAICIRLSLFVRHLLNKYNLLKFLKYTIFPSWPALKCFKINAWSLFYSFVMKCFHTMIILFAKPV